MTETPRILWQPTKEQIAKAQLTCFIDYVEQTFRPKWKATGNFDLLYDWSVQYPDKFWQAVWDFGLIEASQPTKEVLVESDQILETTWFPTAKLNFAENLLRYRDAKDALVFWGEQEVRSALTYNELHALVSRLSQALTASGVSTSDRVAAFMPNMPETIVAMLATTALGAVWSSCSPDFGVQGVIDRFGQIEPKVLFTADGYFYKGQKCDSLAKVREIVSRIPSIETIIVVPYLDQTINKDYFSKVSVSSLDDFIGSYKPRTISFKQLPFNHPLYIMYSSGTTGKPKCIVHGAGGTLLEHIKEHVLHLDLGRADKFFYQTTCGWMMWNWLASGLASGATLLLYDGAPFLNDGNILFDLAEQEQMTIFGTNAKYLSSVEKAGLEPNKTHNLSALRSILSTGSVLAPESFDFVYKKISAQLCLSSIAGGTDIIGCFALGCSTLPVYRGELQCRSLGLEVEVYNDEGVAVENERGELVCSAPFPSMPIYFWNDKNKTKYSKAYFARYPNVWHHGDYVELTDRGTVVFYGRSDAVLNPGGIRIGTAEIYQQVEKITEVLECVAVGQTWKQDTRVVLFVKLQDGLKLTEELRRTIKQQIKHNASPFHVPQKIVQVADIPRTRSGKITELLIRDLIHGKPAKNIEALANPEALQYYENLLELEQD
ncbi:acetoacetate--CoA ligase [Oligoflexia bacterium]|nr:acetoacetate--CoA ligase [Oligoflexia bacterium]